MKIGTKKIYNNVVLTRKINNLVDLEELSRVLIPLFEPSIYLILQGELGAGKTTLTQFIAKNLGIREKITSPTFNILQRYQVNNNYHLNHFDFFRLNPSDNLDIFQELTTDNLNIIEWPDKNPQFWQKEDHIRIKLVKKNSGTRIATVFFSPSLSKSKKIIKIKIITYNFSQ